MSVEVKLKGYTLAIVEECTSAARCQGLELAIEAKLVEMVNPGTAEMVDGYLPDDSRSTAPAMVQVESIPGVGELRSYAPMDYCPFCGGSV